MPIATVAIVTRNRKETAAKAIESALAQRGDVEVVVFDDASTDGTSDLIRERFPGVRLERAAEQKGVRFGRNRTVELATAPVVFSLDDDAVFDTPEVVRDVLEVFDDPRIGAVAVPHDNHFRDGRVEPWWPPLPDPSKTWVVPTFAGGSNAVRRDAFLKVGGYQTALTHWGEEQDFCQRLYGAGLAVRLSPVGLVRHYPEGGADKYVRKSTRHISCNALATVWLNAPARYVAPRHRLFAVAVRRQGRPRPQHAAGRGRGDRHVAGGPAPDPEAAAARLRRPLRRLACHSTAAARRFRHRRRPPRRDEPDVSRPRLVN